MGTSVQSARTSKRVSSSPRKRQYESPLDRAAAFEVVWPQVERIFSAARQIDGVCFVYVIGEEDGGAIKIGSAKDPVLRLRGLQTGNPRRLRIEYVLLGDTPAERLMHELWEPFSIKSKRAQAKVGLPSGVAAGTEWFRAEIRPKLEPILLDAQSRQWDVVFGQQGELTFAELEQALRDAHIAAGFVAQGRDQARLVGAGGGYVINRPSRI